MRPLYSAGHGMFGAIALLLGIAAAVLLYTHVPGWRSTGFARCVAAGYPPVKWPEDRWFNAIAANEVTDAIAVSHDEGLIDLWSGCGPSGKHELDATFKNLRLNFSPRGKYLVGTSMFAGGTEIWEVASHERVAAIEGTYGPALFTPDERFAVLTRFGGGIQLYDLHSRAFIGTAVSPDGDSVTAFAANEAFSKLVVGLGSGGIIVIGITPHWNGYTLKRQFVINDDEDAGWVAGLGFSRTGQDIVKVARFGPVTLWDATTGRQRKRIERGRFHATQTLFYARGNRVAILGARLLDAMRPDSIIEIIDLAGDGRWDIPTNPGAQGTYLDNADRFLLVEVRNPLRLVKAR